MEKTPGELRREFGSRTIGVIRKVFEELAEEYVGFSHLDSILMREIVVDAGNYPAEEIKLVNAVFFHALLKEEILAFSKRNSKIITHFECYGIIVRLLLFKNETEMTIKTREPIGMKGESPN